MNCFQILRIGNSIVVELSGLTNSVTEAVDTGATMEVTLLDSAGAEVPGATWPMAMPHAGSGDYRATLPHTVELTDDAYYTALITATGSGGEVGDWRVNCKAEPRTR